MNARVKRLLPYVAPIAVLGVMSLVLVAPRVSAARRAGIESTALRTRLSAVQESLTLAAPAGEIDLAVRAFERRIPVEDRVPDLLESLARVALDPATGGEVRNLRIDTGDRMAFDSGHATAPRVAGGPADAPDVRLALFDTGLTYSPVTVSFDASYAGLGRFLWGLRDLPTAIEIRSVDVMRPAKPPYDSPFLHVELVLYAFQRGKPRI
jgi:hypothetical protein